MESRLTSNSPFSCLSSLSVGMTEVTLCLAHVFDFGTTLLWLDPALPLLSCVAIASASAFQFPCLFSDSNLD